MPNLEDIRSALPQLTNKQRSIAEYILAQPDAVAGLTLKDFSGQVHASEVSVLRTCGILGFDGYAGLKRMLLHYGQAAIRAAQHSAAPSSAVSARLRDMVSNDLNNLIGLIEDLDEENLFCCARDLLAAEEVFVFAHDATNYFSQYLCYRLEFLRIKATNVKLGDGDMMQTALARMRKHDAVVLFSFPPYHDPISGVAAYCRSREVPIAVITDSAASPAVVEGSNVFLCRTSARYYYNSHVATLALINLLTSCISVAMGKRFDAILAEEQDVNEFLRGGYASAEDDI